MPRKKPIAVLLLVAGVCALPLVSCRSTLPNRDPLGDAFPRVTGESLDGEERPLPPEGAAVLLLGYAQDAQFDADRWLYGLLQADLTVPVYEVPTIKGLFPSVISGVIDDGMRSGIPDEDWGVVVTVYGGDASEIVELTGNEKPRNIRVVLVDDEGLVRWFHDRGFSAGKLIELEAASRTLANGAPGS